MVAYTGTPVDVGRLLAARAPANDLLRRRGDTVTLTYAPRRAVSALSADTREGDRRYAQALRRDLDRLDLVFPWYSQLVSWDPAERCVLPKRP